MSKSTGPNTARGKAASSMNALKPCPEKQAKERPPLSRAILETNLRG